MKHVIHGLWALTVMVAVSADAAVITLMDSTTNDGSFESVFTGTGDNVNVAAEASVALGSVWTFANNAVSPASEKAGWVEADAVGARSDGSIGLHQDEFNSTATVTSIDILGVNGYDTVTAGEEYAWAFDVTSKGSTTSSGSLSLSFDGGSNWVLLGAKVTDNGIKVTWQTGSGTYAVTSQNATDAATHGLLVQGLLTNTASGDIRFDNVQLSVIPEPATLGMIAASGLGILFVRRRLML